MISITDLAMQYGQKTLFENASLNFDPGKRYGLVGANGSGKSTLLRIISGEELPSKGLVSIPKNLSPGLLKQDHFRYENVKVSDVVLQGIHVSGMPSVKKSNCWLRIVTMKKAVID